MTQEPGRDAQVVFLLDLIRALHLAYHPATLIDRRVRRAAAAWGFELEVFTLQSAAMTAVISGAPHRVDLRRLPLNPHWNLRRASALIQLTDAIAARGLPLEAARAELDSITASRPAFPLWAVLIAYGTYGAVVCMRVGGGWVEAFAASIAGLVAGLVHYGTLASLRIDLQKSFLAAFAGAAGGFVVSLGFPDMDVARAVFGGATLLIPATVVTLASAELVSESAEAGLTRLIYALLRFVMLGVGLLAAGRAVALVGAVPALVVAEPLPSAVVIAAVAVGGAALVVCMSARWHDAPWIVGAVLLAYGVQELTKLWVGEQGSPLITAFVLGVAGRLYSLGSGRVAWTVTMPGLLQIGPGFLGTQAVISAIHPSVAPTQAHFFDVLIVGVQVALGLMLAWMIHPPERLVAHPARHDG